MSAREAEVRTRQNLGIFIVAFICCAGEYNVSKEKEKARRSSRDICLRQFN